MSEQILEGIEEKVKGEEGAVEENKTEPDAPKTYTEDELKILLQKEGDRRVTGAMKELAGLKVQIEELKKSSMSEVEKIEYERQQEKDKLRLELEEKQAALAKYIGLAEAKSRGWGDGVVEYIADTDPAKAKEKADLLKAALEPEIAKARKDLLSKGNVPMPSLQGLPKKEMTLEDVNFNDPESLRKYYLSAKGK